MKNFAKLVMTLAFAASITACGGEGISGSIDGKTGDIVIEPGCLIFCGK